MSTSPAQAEANRKNALRSTGPRTEEGKEASRRNALKHALTGGGVVVPNEDLAQIASVAKSLHEEYQPTTTIGHAMIEQSAVLIVRIGRCGKHEIALVADQVAAAKYDFDQARRDYADELFDGLEANPQSIDELLRFPEGLDRLIEEWSTLAGVEEWSPEAQDRLDRISDAGVEGLNALRAVVPNAIGQLEALKTTIDTRPIAFAREHAAAMALFSTSREATLARRYEAAAVKALDKAMKTFHEVEGTDQPTETPQTSDPDEPLASFSPEPHPRPVIPVTHRPGPSAVAPVDPEPPVKTPKRPDPQKLRAQMDRKRRR